MRRFWKNQQGSVIVTMALMFSVFMGFGGLALDIGNLYVTKTRMQNAADAAVAGGGLFLTAPGVENPEAQDQANSLITSNGFDPAIATITFNQTANNPENKPQINCRMTQNVPTYFMGLFGFDTVTVAAYAEAKLVQGSATGPFKYALFSKNSLTLSGNKNVTGSVHTNNNLSWSGNKTVSGAVEGKAVSISGNSTIGSAVAQTANDITVSGNYNNFDRLGGCDTNIEMPDYSQQINDIAATHYYTNKTFSGITNIDGNIYVDGNVTLSGNINTTGAILATGNITISGNTTISGSNQICLYSQNGNITISGNFNTSGDSSAIIYAPNSTNGNVTISGNQDIHGSIIANRMTISGNLTIDGANYPVTTLPATKAHVQLIQ